MYVAEALVPLWTESSNETGQGKTLNRPILIVVETLGATLRGQLLDLTESRARVRTNDPFLMCSNVRVTLRFRFNDVVYSLSGLTQAIDKDDSFYLIFDAVTRQKILIFVGSPDAGKTASAEPGPPRKRTKEEQRIVRRDPPPHGIERRRHPRHILDVEAGLSLIQQGTILKCRILEVSTSGCRLFNEVPLVVAENTLVEVEFLGLGYPFRLAARTRVKTDEHLIGLEFLSGSTRTLERLRELISELEMNMARAALEE